MADKELPKLGPSRRGGTRIEVGGDKPSIICDSDGTIAAIVVPHFLRSKSLVRLFTIDLAFISDYTVLKVPC